MKSAPEAIENQGIVINEQNGMNHDALLSIAVKN
jgi:hypothetical protein